MQFLGLYHFRQVYCCAYNKKNIMLKAMQKQFCGKMAELKGRIT